MTRKQVGKCKLKQDHNSHSTQNRNAIANICSVTNENKVRNLYRRFGNIDGCFRVFMHAHCMRFLIFNSFFSLRILFACLGMKKKPRRSFPHCIWWFDSVCNLSVYICVSTCKNRILHMFSSDTHSGVRVLSINACAHEAIVFVVLFSLFAVSFAHTHYFAGTYGTLIHYSKAQNFTIDFHT